MDQTGLILSNAVHFEPASSLGPRSSMHTSKRYLILFLLLVFPYLNVSSQEAAVAEPPVDKPKVAAETETASEDSAKATTREETEKFIRITKTDAGRPQGLETSIVRYVGEKGSSFEGVTVDLVGVVHIGQEEYYEQLAKKLATYDVVLYELVAPDGTRVRPEDVNAGRSPLMLCS